MGWWSLLGLGVTAPTVTDDLCALLRAVLPTFIAMAERTRNSLPDASSPDETRTFYLLFNSHVFNLYAVLVQWNPAETVRRFPADEVKVENNLKRILDELENVFVSQKGEEAGRAFERLGFKRRECESYPKLRALRRTLPKDNTLDEDFLNDIDYIMRIHRKSAEKQQTLLQNLEQALDFFYNIQQFTTELESCPINFSEYPLQHVRELAEKLFGVVQTNWCCPCRTGKFHADRKTRLSLTQHQRFETTPAREKAVSRSEARFRILFPTNSHDLEWQDTEIAVTKQHDVKEKHEQAKNRLCGIIHNLNRGIRPRMVVYAKNLWQLVADAETNPLCPPQVQDDKFRSLKDLLGSDGSNRVSLMSSIEGRDRLILSFVLATSLLHFVDGPWLQASLRSENICFLVSNCSSLPDITKPYLTTSFTSLAQPPVPRDLNQPHQYPDILSLGILLLEIARGAPIDFEESQDRCVVALECRDKWVEACRKGSSRTIPDGLFRAISACVDPTESRYNVPDKKCPKDVAVRKVRKYIFERILYPLEDALSTAYEIKSDRLYADIAQAKEARGIGSIDHQGECGREKQLAGEEWLEHLRGKVHQLLRECQDRCDSLREEAKKATRVKVAVLDTGLQLPGALQENYEGAERINCQQSATFIAVTGDEATREWKVDRDGHGSRVGEIILRFAPIADLHVAKVFQNRRDLANPNMATQVHKRIADAINRATNEWKVDMIIMCFGFDERIPLIHEAIYQASKVERPPLFFAATRNDGAHKRMAWPARETLVIGVSSTAGNGGASAFNPPENQAYPILYAFGEGVPVQVADPSNPNKTKTEYVSGTSYAAPVAAAMAANLLGCIRMVVETCSPEDRAEYGHVPRDLERMGDMLTVLRRHMQKPHLCGVESLLPWDFLNLELLKKNKILKNVAKTLKKG
ncbi:hypothetical protein CEP54_015753 [Fusarium duplospermum]|uniref:Uncharacterized protein n=1 Tax=Fusarium duplospermum TaxID=1325734 RepID=A0A428NLI0_9HYPO|nr:hypothetical protein CEP54_015753 [Fusarium duplospermum]